MLSADASHLRKYLATLGVAIVVGTISLSSLVMRLQDELLVKQSELAELTPIARDTIERRQRYASVVTDLVPFLLFLGCMLGIGLAAYGVRGWAQRQGVADEIEDNERLRSRSEVRKLTAEEREDRVDDEVESLLLGEVVADLLEQEPGSELELEPVPEPNPASSQPKPEPVPEPKPEREPVRVRVRPQRPATGTPGVGSSLPRTEFRELIVRAEQTLQERVTEGFAGSHDILIGVEIGEKPLARTVDLVAVPHSPRDRHIVFDVTVNRQLRNLSLNMSNALAQVGVAASLLSDRAVGVVVGVYQETPTVEEVHRLTARLKQQADTIRNAPRFILVSQDEFQSMGSKSFRSWLGL